MAVLQFVRKFFIDKPIARTKKVYFWFFNYLGMRFPILHIPFYYWFIRRPIRIDNDGRVGMLQLGSAINYGCNLRCEFCSAFSPYLKGFYPADALLAEYTQWRKKIKPQYFILGGGEPLLHPELTRILRESASIWNDSKLWLTTNGLLLERAKPEVLQAIKETGYELIVSEHTLEPEHLKKLDAGYTRLKLEGIHFVIRPNSSTWLGWYQYDEKGSIVPYKSDPKEAWNNCGFRAGTALVGDKLFKCCPLAMDHVAIQKNVLNADTWKTALTYQPLTLQSTPEEIVEHLRRKAIPECTICAEKCVVVPARQLPQKQMDVVNPLLVNNTNFNKTL